MEGKILNYVLICIVVCVLVGATAFYYINQPTAGIITLGCELPTEQPILPILKLQEGKVSNETEARALALKYFPEFENATFIENAFEDPNIFVLKIDNGISNLNEYLTVYSSGCLIYTGPLPIEREVNASEFSQEKALNFSESFISQHGGFGDLYLERITSGVQFDPEGKPTGIIDGYYVRYEHSYNGIPISGGDRITLEVIYNGIVTHFFRLVRTPIEEISQVKIIPASQAFNALTTAQISGNITITNVDICYYSSDQYIDQEHMNPAWRFEIDGVNYLYVDGVTGECL